MKEKEEKFTRSIRKNRNAKVYFRQKFFDKIIRRRKKIIRTMRHAAMNQKRRRRERGRS